MKKEIKKIELFPEVKDQLEKRDMLLVKGGIKPPILILVNIQCR